MTTPLEAYLRARKAELADQIADLRSEIDTREHQIGALNAAFREVQTALEQFAVEAVAVPAAVTPRAKRGEIDLAVCNMLRGLGVGHSQSVEHLLSALPEFKPDSVKAVLRRLVKAGAVLEDDEGYQLADTQRTAAQSAAAVERAPMAAE